jgi:hypothetical protein
MRYYVPVGPGGVFFRLGMVVTGMMGSVVYWRASRRRYAARLTTLALPVGHRGSITRRPATSSAIGLVTSSGQSASKGMPVAAIDRWRLPPERLISQ